MSNNAIIYTNCLIGLVKRFARKHHVNDKQKISIMHRCSRRVNGEKFQTVLAILILSKNKINDDMLFSSIIKKYIYIIYHEKMLTLYIRNIIYLEKKINASNVAVGEPYSLLSHYNERSILRYCFSQGQRSAEVRTTVSTSIN